MVLDVSLEYEEAVLERVRSGLYASTDGVLTWALMLLEWAESDPVGKRQLQRLAAIAAGLGDSEAESDRIVFGEREATRTPGPRRRLPPAHPARRGRRR